MIRSCSVFFALLISVCAFSQESDSANKETLIITLKSKSPAGVKYPIAPRSKFIVDTKGCWNNV